MTRKRKIVLAIVALLLALGLVGGAIAVSCGGDEATKFPAPGSPVGSPILPDLMPSPQRNVATQKLGERWRMRFNTIITNVGESDFILRATRTPGRPWLVEQDIPYSTSGGERVPTKAALAWGGDGHDHWHVIRVASVWLVPLDVKGTPVSESRELIDTKIGFCFYDHTHELSRGPAEGVYSARTCGHEDDTELGMGLSPGWNDTYLQSLPGQDIDITDVPDGNYRLWTEVDENEWFREARRDNNRTWIDLELKTTAQGRVAIRTGTGPRPS